MIITEPSIHENLAAEGTTNSIISPEISQSQENLNLLDQLTKISNLEYIGKELCTVCLKNVTETQQSISCSNCERWTHRKCTNTISRSKYNKLCQLLSFNWYCSNCRETETPLPKITEPLKLDSNNLPCKFSIVKKGKK